MSRTELFVFKMNTRIEIVLCIFIIFIFIQCGWHLADGACSFPEDLQNATWHSSDMGDVTFNDTHFSVSQIVDFGPLTFTCISQSGKGYYSESNSFLYLGILLPFKVSICFKLKKKSATKYIYYPQSSVLANTDVNRIFFHTATYSFSAVETCNEVSKDISHTRLLIKEGYVNVSSVDCDNVISGLYSYNVTGSACTETMLDVCTDKNEMIFNYTYCSDTMAYSAGGMLSCVYKEVSSGISYTIVYNEDATTDESTYYRYTCLVADFRANGTSVTTYPRACLATQDASVIAAPGLAFILSANTTCKTIPGKITIFAAGTAVVVLLALLILIAAVAVMGLWYYLKIHRLKRIKPDMIPAKSPPIDTKEQAILDGRVSPFSPYPTVSELAMYRFGPTEIDDDDGGMTLDATTPGLTDGRRTMYGKDVERESQASLPLYSEVGGETPEPTRLSEVHTRMSEISEVSLPDATPFTMTRATMNIPEESRVSPLQTPTDSRPNGAVQSPRDNGDTIDVTL